MQNDGSGLSGDFMEAYTDFAKVYDELMDETPYRDWAEYISGLISGYGVSLPYKKCEESLQPEDRHESDSLSEKERLDQEKNLVVELGCGTGKFTEEMADLGYDMVGIDNSEDMLGIARSKMEKSGKDILYLMQDMTELDLFCTAGTIVSVCDSINYLTTDEEILKTFKLVNNFLYPGGVFIFDFNTVYKYKDMIGDTTIAENREDCSFIWENYFDEDTNINEYDLTVFVKTDDGERQLFEKFEETHFQRGYTLDEMKDFIEKSGLKFICAIDADTHDKPGKTSERIYIVAGENGKK